MAKWSAVWAYVKAEQFFIFELMVLVRAMGYGIQMLTQSLLIQDKVCTYIFGESDYFCQHISDKNYAPEKGLIKDRILADAALFSNYANLIQAVPMVIWSFFVGSFLDNFKGGMRFVLVVGNIVDMINVLYYLANVYFFEISPYYILISSTLTFFTGGMTTQLTACMQYLILHSTEAYRPFKFIIFQFLAVVAVAIGTFLGGNLMTMRDSGPQLRNYHTTLLINLGCSIIGIVILFFLNYNVPEKNDDANESKSSEDDQSSEIDPNTLPDARKLTLWDQVCILFNFENVRETFHTLLKPRPNGLRSQLIILYVIIFIGFMDSMGIMSVFLQFSQKVYHWNPQTFSTVSAVAQMIQNPLMMLNSYIFLRKLKISDGTMLVWTLPFAVLNYIMIGTILYPAVYLISIPLNSMAGLPGILAKNKLSKIVHKDEVAKIFSLTASMESIAPFLGSFVMTRIFSATVSTIPGLTYLVCAGFSLVSLVLAVFQELYYVRPNPISASSA